MKYSASVLLCLIACLLCCNNAQGQIHVTIKCMTADCSMTEDVRTDTVFGTPEQMNLWLQEVLFPLRVNGYPSAAFDVIETEDNEVIAYLNPGPRIVIGKISPGNIDEKILEKIRFREKKFSGRLFNSAELYELLQTVSNEYANRGYPFAKVYLGDLEYKNDTVQAVLSCDAGALIIIDTLINKGNLDLNPGVLFSMTGIAPGDPYNQQTLKSMSQRLKKFNFVRVMKPPEISCSEGSCVVYVFLDKKPVNSVDGIIGFMPDYRDGGKLFLTGELLFSVTNSMNLGERVYVRWKQPERYSQTLKTGIMLPSVVLTPFGVSWDFYLQKKDTSWVSTDNKILLSYPGYRYAFPGAYVQYFSSSLLSVKQFQSATSLPPVGDMKLVSLGLQFIYNKVNFVENPRSGIMLNIDGSAGKKTIIKNSALEDDLYTNIEMTSARIKAIADISLFVPLGLNSAIMLRTYDGMLVAGDVFENEMFRLGGLLNIRGFDEEQFFSTAFGLQSLEYRYLFSELSRFVVFVDYSYIEKRTDETLTIYRPLSAGAGVTLETNSGLFSLFWAVGKMHKQTPDFRGSKIHFGYMVLF